MRMKFSSLTKKTVLLIFISVVIPILVGIQLFQSFTLSRFSFFRAPRDLHISSPSVASFSSLSTKKEEDQKPRVTGVPMNQAGKHDGLHGGTTRDDLHPITRSLLEGKKVFMYQRYDNGIGSFLLNFFLLALYYRDNDHNRTVHVLDERNVRMYRRSQNIGAPGFFDFTFPVLNNQSDWDRLFKEFRRVGLSHLANETALFTEKWSENTGKHFPIIWVRQGADQRYLMTRKSIAKGMYFKKNDVAGVKQMQVFERFTNLTCQSMWFHNETLEYTRQRLRNHSIPDFATSRVIQSNDGGRNTTRTNNVNRKGDASISPIGTTVAFHIRRGDKVFGKRRESFLHTADDYVRKFLTIPHVNIGDVKHCFVESDEYNATIDLRASLKEHNISCHFHSMVPLRYMRTSKDNSESYEEEHLKYNFAYQNRTDVDEIWNFLSGLYMMVHATYFVGSFDSNVAGLATLLRGCVWKRAKSNFNGDVGNDISHDNRFDHYYHSYGVGTNNWFIF